MALSALFLIERSGLASVTSLMSFVRSAGVYGPLALIAAIAFVSVSLTIPAAPFIILAGALYGAYIGTAYAMLGLLLGWSVAFSVARLFREPVVRLIGAPAQILLRFQERFIGTVIFVTRAFPVFSFEIISYAAGLTAVSYPRYLLASLGAVAPVFVLAFLGAIGKRLPSASHGITIYVLTTLVIVVIFVLPLAIDHYDPFGWKERFLREERVPKR